MYSIIDLETTGGSARFDKITEIAVLLHDGEKVVKEFSTLINPERYIPPQITRLTSITNEMVADAPKFYEVAKEIIEITDGTTMVAHNANFDYGFLREEFKSLGYNYYRPFLCTVRLSRKLIPGYPSYSLGSLCEQLGIVNEARHRAAGDAMATAKLFDLLLSRDHDLLISKNIRNEPALMKLPPNLDKDCVGKLPEETGVYYFYNSKGDIIYIGKSTNIRKRVLSHFSEKEIPKSLRMKEEVCDITYEITGSELVALLLESDEIKKYKPIYNRLQREAWFQWGIFKSLNDEGYITLKAARIRARTEPVEVKKEEEPLITARNFEEATEILSRQVDEYNLCQKLCGIYDIKHACFRHYVNQCKGACVGKEAPEEYNQRVIRLMRKWRYENQNFFIIGNGRNRNEQSVVAVERGRYLGFGFVDSDFSATNPEQLKFFIKSYADNRDVQRIIRRHLQGDSREKLIVW